MKLHLLVNRCSRPPNGSQGCARRLTNLIFVSSNFWPLSFVTRLERAQQSEHFWILRLYIPAACCDLHRTLLTSSSFTGYRKPQASDIYCFSGCSAGWNLQLGNLTTSGSYVCLRLQLVVICTERLLTSSSFTSYRKPQASNM